MFVLHGAFVPASSAQLSVGFFLWGEADSVRNETGALHPRSVHADELESVLRAEGVALGAGARTRGTLQLTVPAWQRRPVPSSPALRDAYDYTALSAPEARPFEVEAVFLSAAGSLELLLDAPDTLRASKAAAPGEDLEYWSEVARWAFDLLLRRRVAPGVEEGVLRWRAILADPREKERLDRFAAAMPAVSRAILPQDAGGARGPVFPTASALLRSWLDEALDGAARDLIREVVPAESRRGGPGEQSVAIASLASASPRDARLSPELVQRIHDWTLPLLEPLPAGELRLGIRLHTPDAAAEPPLWTLSYHLEADDDPTLTVAADEVWAAARGAIRRGGVRLTNTQEVLLSRLGRMASLSPAIQRSLDDRHPVGATLPAEEAFRFLTSEAPLLSEAGAKVYLPTEGRLARISVRLRASDAGWKSGAAVTRFGLATLVDFDWRVAIGDTLLTPDEFEQLAAQKTPLVALRGEWVLLDRDAIARTLRLFDKRPSGRTTLGELLRLGGGLEAEQGSYPIEALEGDGWLGELLDPISARREIAAFEAPKTLTGTLRPYQLRGVAWLRFLLSRGLGACLADDMGLGKTVQLLAALLSAGEAGEVTRPALLVCPTSVAENWVQEAARFAPHLKVAVHHGPDRVAGEDLLQLAKDVDLLVTTYALTHRDRALLSEIEWEYLVLDEAQNVKNPSAAQSRAVRALKARRRAALTGTPVENRLAELKAIFDVLNPGLLGTDEEFRTDFAVPIERQRDPAASERLRRITAPFLLRRAKTDEGVAPDLPEKIETKEYVGLTREQATLYRATTRDLLARIETAGKRGRRARVLLLLLRLKQICDHPALFLRDSVKLDGRSAKLTRLLSMLEETLAEKTPALLFTQFASMGHILVRTLRERFGTEVFFLHGGVPRGARDEMVRRFQESPEPPPFFVLSLKAGGSGLNLTRASHVFHVDRWWNPAVEDQATDRAFRIGQHRNVQVHKFVCKGTLEERIDAMIEEKKALARTIVGAGESWLTELSDTELASLVALSRDAVEEER